MANMIKRFLFLLAVCLLTISGGFAADDTVRAAQTRLKEGGFYFGEINGAYSSETSAAVSRYQIRRGLPISGKLDAETIKSLGLTAAQTAPEAQPSTETWRNLRKTDRQFLERMQTDQAPAVAGKASGSDYGSVLVLSQERLRDYVAAFVLAGLDPQVGAELEFFGDKVRYYNDGLVDREKIRRDLATYNQRWPNRRFWLAGKVNVQPQPDSRVQVTFPLRYDLRNAKKHSSGRVTKTLTLEVVGEDLQIVGVNERKG
jgi:hypothetical protein